MCEALFPLASSTLVIRSLGELCEEGGGNIQTGPFGSQLHASDYVEHGIPSIMPKNIGENRVSTEDIAYISKEDAKRLSRYLVKPGDIVYSRRGDVEKRALIRESEAGWLCGTGCLRVRSGNGNLDPVYLSYYFAHPAVRSWIVQHAIGATMPNLNTSILSSLPVVVPPKHKQHRIAHILGTLDDKIELNRRMNRTLEAIARAIFKSWFIDFDPVIDNALASGKPIPEELRKRAEIRAGQNQPSPLPSPIGRGWQKAPSDGAYGVSSSPFGRGEGEGAVDQSPSTSGRGVRGEGAVAYHRLFPDEFQDSPLGKIPKGWEVGKVENLLSLSRDSIKPQEFPEEAFDHFSIPAFDAGRPSLDFGESIRSSKYLIPSAAVLISKLNPHLPRVWLPHVSGARRAVCSTEFLVSMPKLGVPREYLYSLLSSAAFLDRFAQLVTGTTGSHQRVRPTAFQKMDVVIPPQDLSEAFARSIGLILHRCAALLIESSELVAIRDALLPRLFSGKLELAHEGTAL